MGLVFSTDQQQAGSTFRFGGNGRDIMVEPGDNLVFERITFDAGNVNVGPVWNRRPADVEAVVEERIEAVVRRDEA